MSRVETKVLLLDGDLGFAAGIALFCVCHADDVVMVVQLLDGFELWTMADIPGRNVRWLDRCLQVRRPLEELAYAILTDRPDWELHPTYVAPDAPLCEPSASEFERLANTGVCKFEDGDGRRQLILDWWFTLMDMPLGHNVSMALQIVTSESFNILRRHTAATTQVCQPCRAACADTKQHICKNGHALCSCDLAQYLSDHVRILRRAQRGFGVMPIVCPMCFVSKPQCVVPICISTFVNILSRSGMQQVYPDLIALNAMVEAS